MKLRFNEEFLRELNNKSMDIILLFIYLEKLKNYDYKFYMALKKKFIIILLKFDRVPSTIILNELHLNLLELELFYYWFNYIELDKINLNKLISL